MLAEEQHHSVPKRWRYLRLEGASTVAFSCATTSTNTTSANTAVTTTAAATSTNTTDTYVNSVEELVLRKCGHGCAV
jgi:hypothetical protein